MNYWLNKNIKIGVVLIFLFLISYFILPVSYPLIFAWTSAVCLNPVVTLLEHRWKINRTFSTIITFTTFFITIGFVLFFSTIKLITYITYASQNISVYFHHMTVVWFNILSNLENKFEDIPLDIVKEINFYVIGIIEKIRVHFINLDLFGTITNIILNIPNYLVAILVYLISMFLFLVNLPKLKKTVFFFLTEDTADKVCFIISRLKKVIIGFFKAQFLVSIPIFLVTYVGLIIIKPEVALAMAILIWVIDLIPLIGSIIIMGPWTVFYFISGDLEMAIKLGILSIILLVIRRTVEPKIMGEQIGLSPLATLISLFLGLMLFGAVGLFIGPLILIVVKSAFEAGIIKSNFKL
ncbi:sporulation integral membrane protein YtvI [Bacillus sp. FJAT-45350]|uniref:sporulation integral membrane protein YtvI n=1 Tax=Bacillus sp. FJAT-45350 TaxID=2011014 RepID=UPI00211D15B9|nr:sporulation integral membrane protein YtvI [Bacillus sp. FJAT-45350]